MTTDAVKDKPSYEQFREEWLAEIVSEDLDPFHKGLRFGVKLISQWLEVTSDDDDFVVCDGAGDGGIDIAYLQRTDDDSEGRDSDTTIEGHTWYLVQSKYGSAFTGADTILEEGTKVIRSLLGETQHLSDTSRRLLQKLNQFRQQASDADRIILVFATTDPISQQDRQVLDDIKLIGRERGIQNFDVEEVSLLTIWEALEDVETPKLSVPVKGRFVEQYAGLLVGTVSLFELFECLKAYHSRTGDLDKIYEKNVRRFLGNKKKINKGIAKTLNETPEKFGLYNNGITIVVSGYSKSPNDDTVDMNDPYIVNGCQTTRTIWQVLDSKLNAGGTGQDSAMETWKERAKRGGIVTKIVSSDEAEITNITRFTNSQNSVREQDFIALDRGFQNWAADMAREYGIFLEIQRGATESRKAWEKQHPEEQSFNDYVNAFDLIKVYGAGWLGSPGLAFGKNAPFLPNGSIYERIMLRGDTEGAFGAPDLYAAYQLKRVADKVGFGRTASQSSRRQSRFLFYHIFMSMLSNIILLTPELKQPDVTASALTDTMLKLSSPDADAQLSVLTTAAVVLLDQYLTVGSDISAHKETSFIETHNGDLNGFLKAENLGKENHSPLLRQSLAIHNASLTGIPMSMESGSPTRREFIAQVLLKPS